LEYCINTDESNAKQKDSPNPVANITVRNDLVATISIPETTPTTGTVMTTAVPLNLYDGVHTFSA